MTTPRALRAALLAVAAVSAVSALAGMVGLILGDGMGLPRSALDATPFDSWVWPAIILGVVVGGTQLLAVVAQVLRLSLAWSLHAASGLVLVIWTFVEVAMLLIWSPLQGVFFALGVVQVVLAVLALGAWPRPALRREQWTE